MDPTLTALIETAKIAGPVAVVLAVWAYSERKERLDQQDFYKEILKEREVRLEKVATDATVAITRVFDLLNSAKH